MITAGRTSQNRIAKVFPFHILIFRNPSLHHIQADHFIQQPVDQIKASDTQNLLHSSLSFISSMPQAEWSMVLLCICELFGL
jgi:hypothetical protein